MYQSLVDGTMKYDQIKRMITLTGDNIKQLSLYFWKQCTADAWHNAYPKREKE